MTERLVALVDDELLGHLRSLDAYELLPVGSLGAAQRSLKASDDALLLDLRCLAGHQALAQETCMTRAPVLLVADGRSEGRAVALLEQGADEYLLRDALNAETLTQALRRAQARCQYRRGVQRKACLAQARHAVGKIVAQQPSLDELGERLAVALASHFFRAAWLSIDVPLAPRRTFHAGWSSVHELDLGQVQGEPPGCMVRLVEGVSEGRGATPEKGCCETCHLEALLHAGQLLVVPFRRGGQRFGQLACVMPHGLVATALERETLETLADEVSIDLATLLVSADLQRVTERLHTSEERFRRAFDSTEVGMALLNLEGQITEVNGALCRFLGRGRESLLELTFADVTAASDVHIARAAYAGLRAGAQETFTLEKRYLHGESGRPVWGIASVAVVRDPKGEPSHFVAHVQDIDQRKAVEQALAASEARYRNYISTCPDGFAVLDHRGRVTALNETLVIMSGYDEAALRGRRLTFLRDARASDERLERIASLAFEVPLAVETPVLTAAGERRVWSIHAARIDDGAMVFCRDITDERELHSRLAQADRMAIVGVLAAGVAHEINNPLAFVLHNLEGLSEELEPLLSQVVGLEAEARAEILERIGDAVVGAERVRGIVRDLKTFARVDEGRRVPTSLAAMLDGAAAMAQNELKYRARVVRRYDDEVPRVVVNDGKLAQVALNLIVNAAHAIEDGAREENVVELSTFSDAEHVGFAVRDTGKGIAEEALSQIFEPFYSTKDVGVGSGLGLPICRAIIEELNGHIEVESVLGEGSRFTVYLPRELVRQRPSSPQPVLRTSRERGLRLLLVDDEPALGMALARMLRRLGHEVTVKESGADALRFLEGDEGRSVDALLCDMMMPRMSGMELYERLVVRHPALAQRTIFISGGAFTAEAAAFLDGVQNPKLDKPFGSEDVEEALQKVLGTWERRPSKKNSTSEVPLPAAP